MLLITSIAERPQDEEVGQRSVWIGSGLVRSGALLSRVLSRISILIRSYAATATMTSFLPVPPGGASALVRAKHRGPVACPQAPLSTRSTAPRRRRDGCATLPPSRQEQGTGRHAPPRRYPR